MCWPLALSGGRLVRVMQLAGRSLLAFAFTIHLLMAPFWVRCHSFGPNGHDRLELVFATCCADCHDREAAGEPRDCTCSIDPNSCKTCRDEKVQQPNFKLPSQDVHVLTLPAILPQEVFLAASPILSEGFATPPDHTGDPPLFLAHCNFRI